MQKKNYFLDTDSFVYEIKTDCFYSDMKDNIEWFDTSDYPSDNIFNMPRLHKKVPGLFKDEMNSRLITEFVGLRSKMYCVRAMNSNESKESVDNNNKNRTQTAVDAMKKAKGVRRYVLKKQITFDDYLNCIKNCCVVTKYQNGIRSKLHQVYSIREKKIALSPYDNKRIILDNNINTLPWGHYNTLQ